MEPTQAALEKAGEAGAGEWSKVQSWEASGAAHPVIGVGDVHGGDAQEVNEGRVVAASTQRAHAAGRKMDGLEAAGPARPPGVPALAPAPDSPGDQAIHGTAAVEIPDPVVVDAEAARAWCGDLTRGECSLGVGPAPTQQLTGPLPGPP